MPDRPKSDGGRHTFRHFAMNCDWQVTLEPSCGDKQSTPEQYARAVAELFEEVDRIERELSRFRPDSDIGQFNALPAGASQRLGSDAYECVILGLQLFQATDGAFDISLGTGLDTVRVHAERRTIDKAHASTQLDLGALGKGYALDRLVAGLQEWGLGTGTAHCGQSTIAAFGQATETAIRDPRDQSRVLGHVTLDNETLSGSSNLLYGTHVIDPRHGSAASAAVASWCRAPLAVVSDALATCALLVAPDGLRQLAETGEIAPLGWLLASDAPPLLRTVACFDWQPRVAPEE